MTWKFTEEGENAILLVRSDGSIAQRWDKVEKDDIRFEALRKEINQLRSDIKKLRNDEGAS